MGSTNKTANYELPQWIGTDKPTFLGDLNDAYLKIDTGMAENKGDATSAVATAGAAKQVADNATTKVTELTQTVAGLNDSVEASDAKADAATATAQQALNTVNAQANTLSGHTNSINALNSEVTSINNNLLTNVWDAGNITALFDGLTIRGSVVTFNPFLKLLNIALSGSCTNQSGITVGTQLFKINDIALPNATNRTIYGALSVRLRDGTPGLLDVSISPTGVVSSASENSTGISAVWSQLMLSTSTW